MNGLMTGASGSFLRRVPLIRVLHRLANPVRLFAGRLTRAPLAYARASPSVQQTLDIFKGEWAGCLPPPWHDCHAGRLPLYADVALIAAIARLGGVRDKQVLELGPLEGGHSYLLEKNGAASITAIEGNPRAYLRCLVVKETLGLSRVQFMYGDFVAFLREHPKARYDVAIASGVLYHMEDPVELLSLLGSACDELYLWTHYFDSESIGRLPHIAAHFGRQESRVRADFAHTVHPFHYSADRLIDMFYGGPLTHANWVSRSDIIDALHHFGFVHVDVVREEPSHPHGPAFAVVARRAATPAALAIATPSWQ